MRDWLHIIAAGLALAIAAPVAADSETDLMPGAEDSRPELAPYLQCVPYARQVSGIQIYGDAHTWWGQAPGRYATGTAPRVGAVMAFEPHRGMSLGHVAAVSEVLGSRRVLLDHANWSPINGRRGQVERDVLAIDISPTNDWSEVRVWYAPLGDLGTSAWPVVGFIYPDKSDDSQAVMQIAQRSEPSKRFLAAFSDFE